MTAPDEILVVDDAPVVVKVMEEILSTEGYAVQSATNGQLALDLVAAKQPQLILLDIDMPGMDGFEVCRRLQAQEETRKIPVIFISGITGLEDKVKGLRVGGADFITKPFQHEELLARVRTHLGLSRLRTKLEARDAERTDQLRKLQESEQLFRLLAETIEEVFWMADMETQRMIYVSPSYEQVWGRSQQSLYDNPKSFLESIHPEDRSRVLSTLEVKKIGQPFDHEYRIIRFDGSIRWIWDRGFPVHSEKEQVTLYVGIASDISDRKRAEEALHSSEENYRALFKGSSHGILTTDIKMGRFIDANQSICRMFGYSDTELLQMNILDLHPKDLLDQAISEIKSQIRGEKTITTAFPCLRKDGSVFYADISIAFHIIKGRKYVVSFFTDVSDRKQMEEVMQQAYHELEQRVARRTEELRQASENLQREITERKRVEEALKALSIKDDLTGLYNRRGFFALAEQGLKTAQRMETDMLLIYGDLDNLKKINDTFGHKEGDQALVDISKIFKETFRKSDIIARIGGDEFVILAMNSLEASAEKLINRIEQVLDDLHLQTKRPYKLSLSLGTACFDPKNPCSLDVLVAEADRLMYENKQKKGDRFKIISSVFFAQTKP